MPLSQPVSFPQPGDDPSFNLRIEELLSNRTPDSTKKSTRWAVNKFNTWYQNSNLHESSTYTCFEEIPIDRLNYMLTRFVVEFGEGIRIKTMYAIISGLNRKLKEVHGDSDLDLFHTKRFTEAGFENVTIRSRSGHSTDFACNRYKRPNQIEEMEKVSAVHTYTPPRHFLVTTTVMVVMMFLVVFAAIVLFITLT